MSNRLSIILLTVVALCCLASCGNGNKNDVTYIPFQSEEEGKWGMISTEGKVLFENEFHNVPTYVTDERFFVQNQDGFWEMYSATEKPEKFGGEYRYVTPFSNGVAMVTPRNGAISIIDKKGLIKTQLQKLEGKAITQAGAFCGKIAPVTCDTLFGAVDTDGKTVLSPIYRNLEVTQQSRLIASDYAYISTHALYDSIKPQGKQLIFDDNGKELFTLDVKKYFSIVPQGVTDKYITVNNCKTVTKSEETGQGRITYPDLIWTYSIIDYEGNIVVSPSKKITSILAVCGEYFIYTNEDYLVGVKKIDGTDIINPEYDGINFIGTQYIAAEKHDIEDSDFKYSFKLYNLEGKQVSHDVYTGIAGNRNYRAIAGNDVFVCSDGDEWNLIDDKGNKIEDMPKIYAMVPYSDGDTEVVSDEINFLKLFKKLNITADSIEDFTFSTSPQQAVQIQQKSWGTYDNTRQRKPKAQDYTNMTSVNIFSMKDGHQYNYDVQYPSAFSRRTFTQKKVIDYVYGNMYWYHLQNVPTGYTFNSIKPSWFKITFQNTAYYGHLRTLYKELAKYVKSWGTVDESNPGATLMTLDSGHRLVLALNEEEVFMKWGKLSNEDVWLLKYSNSEKLQSTYDGWVIRIEESNNYNTSLGFS